MAGTILRLGWTNPQTGAFGAHPQLGGPLDLNDGVTFALVSPDGLELSAPEKTLLPSGNIRTQGERITRAIYRRNRTAVARLIFGPGVAAGATYASFIASVRALVRWIDAAPSIPVTLQWQPPSASSPVSLDVVGAAHALPADERDWLRLQVEPVELVFVVRPGLRGDRVTLSNLVVNPGFEAPGGPGVRVFDDGFANVNAYTVVSGSAPFLAGANIMTIPNGGYVQFGSPTWGAINQWRMRFLFLTGLAFDAILHGTGNNTLYVNVSGTTMTLNQNVGGTLHTFATTSFSLATSTWYWLTITQFPAAPGTPPDLQAVLSADSGGAIGSVLASVGPAATFDAVTALTGAPSLLTGGASLSIGGSPSGVHTLSLFGPGGWAFSPTDGTTGTASGAWEQATANTYGGGAVASFGAARIDAAPAGTLGALWVTYGGGAPAGTSAIPIAPSQTVGLAAWVRSAGVSATCVQALLALEFDASGTFLRSGTVASKTGAQASWASLSGSYTTGASCAYLGVRLEASDSAASANGTIWFDNIQCWNQTTTGQSSMPYCELRFPQSPAQLVVTGLLGDLPAPALLAWGTYLTSWATGATLSYALGRRGRADGTAAAARLVGGTHGYYGTAAPPQATAILDPASYGGYYPTVALTGAGWNARGFSPAPSDTLGSYHLLSRFWTAETLGNLPNVQTRIVSQQRAQAWWGDLAQSDQLGATYGPFVAPLSASATWTLADSGPVSIPPLPAGALTDLTRGFVTPRPQWVDNTVGGAAARCNAQLLLPIDGALVMGLLNNPSNAPFAVTNQWLWVYHDGLLLNRAAVGDAAASTYSLEASPIPNPQAAGGGPGTSSTGVINVNSGADPALILDPTLSLAAISIASGASANAAGGSGVNQLAGVVTDNAGAVLSLHCEIQYSPLYLYPR